MTVVDNFKNIIQQVRDFLKNVYCKNYSLFIKLMPINNYTFDLDFIPKSEKKSQNKLLPFNIECRWL